MCSEKFGLYPEEKETNLKDVLKSDLKSCQGEVDEKLEWILSSKNNSVEKDPVDNKTVNLIINDDPLFYKF